MNTHDCDDCKIEQATVTYVGGTVRCDACSEIFKDKVYAQKMEQEYRASTRLQKHQALGCPDDGTSCPKCCEHEFDSEEGYTCLNCGAEGFEEIMSAAYDRAKDARKYGE